MATTCTNAAARERAASPSDRADGRERLPSPRRRPTRRRRAAPAPPLGRWLGGSAALLIVLAAIAVGVLAWVLRTAAGSAWVVTLVPELKVVAPKGSLLGDFSADRIDITLPGSSGTLRLDRPRWQALDASRGSHGRWLHLTIAALHADRVTSCPARRRRRARRCRRPRRCACRSRSRSASCASTSCASAPTTRRSPCARCAAVCTSATTAARCIASPS
jgi:hypothetical protein